MEAGINNRFMIFSDTDNDTACVDNTLEFAEILNKDGIKKENLNGLSIIHTGDFLDKKSPDLHVLEYWQQLQKKFQAYGGSIRILAGNHEMEIWQRISNGESYNLPKKSLNSLCNFIESIDLFQVDGPVLFIHAYPTVDFLQVLLHYKEVTGNHLNNFNIDHYSKAFKSVEALNQYSYTRGLPNDNYLLFDPENIDAYYRKNGSAITALLTKLEIDCIIHGHRPQQSRTQADHEFSRWIPRIRMIGNDTKVKLEGIGATLLRMDAGRTPEVVFINSTTATKKTGNKVNHLLRSSAPEPAFNHQQSIESHDSIKQEYRKLQQQMKIRFQTQEKQRLHSERKLQEQEKQRLLAEGRLLEQKKLRAHTEGKLQEKEKLRLHAEGKLQEQEQLQAHTEGKLQEQEKQRLHAESKLQEQEKLRAHAEGKLQEQEQLRAHTEGKLQEQEKLRAHTEGKLQEQEKLRAHAEGKLQEQRNYNLLLQQELRKSEESCAKTEYKLNSIQDISRKPKVELPKPTTSRPPPDNKQQQKIKALELSTIQLQKELDESNLTKKQALDYLGICYAENQRIEHEYKQHATEKSKNEKTPVTAYKNKYLKHRQEAFNWLWYAYTAISASALTTAVYYMFS